ncbi:MAG: threonine synthase [Candidatus Lokiarchaeota archaeon]|nr:threonine synthase [Candidatus Lokiarchaeota archaeon]
MNNLKNSLITHLECSFCGKVHDADELNTVCKKCGKVLYPRYDLEKGKECITPNSLRLRKTYNLWRFHEIMPVKQEKYRISLGEGWTPLIHLKNLGEKMGLKELYLKDEGQNPTGTFKSRGLCAAVAKGIELGVKEFSMPTAGNAGAALAAYTAHARVKSHIFAPKDTDEFIQVEMKAMGADLTLVNGLITDAGAEAKKIGIENGWFDVSTLKEPYRIEGKKTMGLELAEHFEWGLPDVIIYPTGGGTGIVGMWKAFTELEELGLIGHERPKMISVQPVGCQPIVRAFENGDEFAGTWPNATSKFGGIRVPSAIGDYLILRAIRESHGTAIAVADIHTHESMLKLAKHEGIMIAGEAAATIAALEKLNDNGFVDKTQKIVLFGTGSGLVTPSLWSSSP